MSTGASRAVGRSARTALAGCLALALLAGCDTASTFAAEDCGPVQRPQLQEGGHLIGDREPPVPYSSSPPTSGWHAAGRPAEAGAYADPVPPPAQVRFLEFGGVVVAHDPALPDEQLAELQQLAGEVEGVLVTPYEGELPGPVTMTAWGTLVACEDVTAADVAAFRDAHGGGPGH